MASDASPKRKKATSKGFPGATLEEALKLARTVEDLGGAASLETAGGALNRSFSSGPGKTLLAAAGYYGFLRRGGDKLEILERGRAAVLGPDEDARRRATQEAVVSPKLFHDLVQRFNGKLLPTTENLENLLRHDYGISKSGAKKAAQVFLESGEYAGILRKEGDSYYCDLPEGTELAAGGGTAEEGAETAGTPPPGPRSEERQEQQRTRGSRVAIQLNLDVSGWKPEQVAQLVRLLDE